MATNLPPHVAANELITSAWGNATVTELERQRQERFNQFDHNGGGMPSPGGYDMGSTVLGPFTYPVRVTVWAILAFGNSNAVANCTTSVVRLGDGVARATPLQQVVAGAWVLTNVFWTYDIAIGAPAGFKTRITVVNATQGVNGSGNGLYHVQRTDIV